MFYFAAATTKGAIFRGITLVFAFLAIAQVLEYANSSTVTRVDYGASEQAYLNSQDLLQLRKCYDRAKIFGSGPWHCFVKIPV